MKQELLAAPLLLQARLQQKADSLFKTLVTREIECFRKKPENSQLGSAYSLCVSSVSVDRGKSTFVKMYQRKCMRHRF